MLSFTFFPPAKCLIEHDSVSFNCLFAERPPASCSKLLQYYSFRTRIILSLNACNVVLQTRALIGDVYHCPEFFLKTRLTEASGMLRKWERARIKGALHRGADPYIKPRWKVKGNDYGSFLEALHTPVLLPSSSTSIWFYICITYSKN